MQAVEWMTAEQAAKHFGFASAKAFEKTASREGIPKHYLSARTPRYNRANSTPGLWIVGKEADLQEKRRRKKSPATPPGTFGSSRLR